MLDFSVSLYLGLKHHSGTLPPYRQLTTGVPAALRQPTKSGTTARALARLVGCEHGVLGVSTLHLFFDLLTILSRENVALFVDDGIYPVARWVVERATGRGTPLRFFAHGDPWDLHRLVAKHVRARQRPVVFSDGYCPECCRVSPIGEYLESIRRFGGLLVVDDTQALGILGLRPTGSCSWPHSSPYGQGGGGSLRYSGVEAEDVVVVNSLAKGFGAPIALCAGNQAVVDRFTRESRTRVHCSPPSITSVLAAERAMAVNARRGEQLRHRLAAVVSRFRRRLGAAGIRLAGNLFPVQSLATIPGLDLYRLYERLQEAGVQAVLKRSHRKRRPQLAFLCTADHTVRQIDQATAIIAHTVHAATRHRRFF
ncbi:MAG: aminotransferase class I/II-fold pyridoxal phosphate-dependent enzyme [Desulfopila sp.]